VIWIARALEIFQVAADASRICGGQVVVAVHVALRALHSRVRPAQRETGG
jgi:small neutral amino acid transporter SnatA (MarC family)